MQSNLTALSWARDLSHEQLEKQREFYETRVRHPKLDEFLQKLSPLLTPHSESNIICGVGATGVGKSTVASTILKRLYDGYARVLNQDTSAIPIVAVEAYANGENRPNFGDLFADIRDELCEPGADKKSFVEIRDGRMQMKPRQKESVRALRRTVENALRYRKTEVCVIDEAYHLMKFIDTDVMDTLKSLTNKSRVKFLLFGSYDLFDLVMRGNGQAARRTSIVSFDRYSPDFEEDVSAFRTVIAALMKRWPCDERPNFVLIARELLELSLGCIGLLKSFLLDASAMQLRNSGIWKPVFLQQAAKSNALRSLIEKEICEGEGKIKDALVGHSLWDAKELAAMTKRLESDHA